MKATLAWMAMWAIMFALAVWRAAGGPSFLDQLGPAWIGVCLIVTLASGAYLAVRFLRELPHRHAVAKEYANRDDD